MSIRLERELIIQEQDREQADKVHNLTIDTLSGMEKVFDVSDLNQEYADLLARYANHIRRCHCLSSYLRIYNHIPNSMRRDTFLYLDKFMDLYPTRNAYTKPLAEEHVTAYIESCDFSIPENIRLQHAQRANKMLQAIYKYKEQIKNMCIKRNVKKNMTVPDYSKCNNFLIDESPLLTIKNMKEYQENE